MAVWSDGGAAMLGPGLGDLAMGGSGQVLGGALQGGAESGNCDNGLIGNWAAGLVGRDLVDGPGMLGLWWSS